MGQTRPAVINACIVALLLATCAAAAQPFALSLGRKIKAGDKYLITTTASFRMRTVFEGPRGPRTDTSHADSVRLHALCDVTSVTEAGEEYEKTMTIRYFHHFVNNATIDVLHTGAIVSVTFVGRSLTFKINGTKPDSDIEALLRLAVRSEGGMKTGEILDPPKAVRVGDTWSVNKRAFAASMAAGATKPVTKSVDGKVRFAGVDVIDGKPCATVVAVVRQNTGLGTEQSPTQTSSYDMTLSVPIDVRYPATASKVRTRRRVEAHGSGLKMLNETDVTVESTFDR